MEESTIPFRPVEIQLGAESYYVAPEKSVTVPFAIINHTEAEDYFEISLQGIPTSWILLDMPVIHLGSKERRQSSLVIQAPSNSPLSEGVYPVTLVAIAQTNPEIKSEVRFELNVGAYEPALPVEQDKTPKDGNRIGLSANTLQFTVGPGENLTVPVWIANQGAFADTFYITLEGIPANWVVSSLPTVRLLPGENREVGIVIRPPLIPSSRAGRHAFIIRANSQTFPGQTAEIAATMTIAAFSQFTTDLTPRRMDAGQTARLRIFNLGNIQETFSVRWRNIQDDLEFLPSRSGAIQVAPGESAVVDFAVSPRNPNWVGGTTFLSYSLIVQSTEGETQTHTGEIINRSLIPVWVLPALLLFCMTAVCGVGFLWNWNQTRLTRATQTAQVSIALVSAQTATAAQMAVLSATGAAVTQTAEVHAATVTQEVVDALTAGAPTATLAPTATALPTDTPAPTFTQAIATFTRIPPSSTPTLRSQTSAPLIQTQTNTPVPPTPTRTFTPVPPMPTSTPIPPTSTATPVPPTATFTLPAPTNTATLLALPVTGQQLITFASDQVGRPQLYVLNTAQNTIQRLSNDPGADTQPAYSPDGKRIAFTSTRDGNKEIYLMNADGTNPVNLTQDPAQDSYPAWSPDGNQIAFTSDRDGNNDIFIMNVDGTNPQNLTQDPANDYKPAWYETGKSAKSTSSILFTSDRDKNLEIYSMQADGSGVTNLTQNPADDSLPAVPFQGGKIAFVSNRAGNNDIYGMNEDGSKQTAITQDPANDTMPVWSPDGKWVAFSSDRTGHQDIYLVQADGKHLTPVTQGPNDQLSPAWK